MTADVISESAVSTWSVDLAHSSLHFRVRHMAIAWVRGEFRIQRATLSWNERELEKSRIDVDIDPASVNTGESQRDEHLRGASFLDVEHFPSMHFRSTQFSRSTADELVVMGELIIRGVSRPIELMLVEMSKPVRDPRGSLRLAGSLAAKLNRKEFGLTWNTVLEAGGLLVGDEIFIDIDIEFLEAAR